MTNQLTDIVPAQPLPLLSTDPVKVGDFWLDARLVANPAGVAYVAHDDDNRPIMVILASEGAAADPAARQRLAGEVNKMHIDTVVARGGQDQDRGRMACRFRAEDEAPDTPSDLPLAPWVALAYDGSQAAVDEATRILTELDLSHTPPLGRPAGPDYRLHWVDQTTPGRHRLWPLPWPGRGDRAGWMTMLTSFLLMLLLAALAVLIAIILFQNFPPQQAPAPVPTQASPGSGGSQQASSTPTRSLTPTMESASPGGTASAEGGEPSRNPRL